MPTTRVTASQFEQAFGALSDKARREPVVITRHGEDSLVVMAAEEWERLKRRDRQVLGLDDFTNADLAALEDSRPPAEAKAFDHEIES